MVASWWPLINQVKHCQRFGRLELFCASSLAVQLGAWFHSYAQDMLWWLEILTFLETSAATVGQESWAKAVRGAKLHVQR